MQTEFYSHGKLLLTGEYAVLDGAQAWAIPTKFGQFLKVSTTNGKTLKWQSLNEHGQTWFECIINLDNLSFRKASDKAVASRLQSILLESKKLNPEFLSSQQGMEVQTKLTFPKNWGLGSSSTLISNIAYWANIDPYKLLAATFGGSGYDIACARHETPILFQLQNGTPIIERLSGHSILKEQLFFVYRNKKQNSRTAIERYRSHQIDRESFLAKIDGLTAKMINTSTLDEFEYLMTEHENILSKVLNLPSLKTELFQDFKGAIKSLGGWGGDFFMATGNQKTPDYFKAKGYDVVLAYNEMAL
ncbi:MAG: GHMP kinase [Croceitalea sp.]|nr:GHMP kinase [Croceitalea sp.]MBT8237968.1 GHMP kinase [Croceitalea sp.]NNC35225.1 GHMP kinase [Croceitalea sp.]NNL09996.1 GHMP kinase [Croceitalea sp.]NNM17079.1 GHMP kinase [Croceitalea sp.]